MARWAWPVGLDALGWGLCVLVNHGWAWPLGVVLTAILVSGMAVDWVTRERQP